MKQKTISIGIICFNEELNIQLCYEGLKDISDKCKKYNFEFVFVDNNSTDNTRGEIRKIIEKDKRAIGVFLSRNFGVEGSTQASLDYSTGDAFICYESDMQDPPEVILDLIKQWEKGFDLVVAIRNKSDEDFFMRIVRKAYYRIFRAISNIEVPVDAGSFALLDRKVMNAIKALPEKYRFNRGLRAWVGFKTTHIYYRRRVRKRGKSYYNFFRYIQHAERSFFGFSYLPLDIIVYLGLFAVLLSLFWISYLLFNQTIKESTLILFAIIFFGGLQLLALSIIGKYIQVIVEETKNRPVYIVEELLKNSR